MPGGHGGLIQLLITSCSPKEDPLRGCAAAGSFNWKFDTLNAAREISRDAARGGNFVAGLENKIKKEVLHGGNGDTADTAGLFSFYLSP